MTDLAPETDSDAAPPPPDATYPDGAVGDLMRQRDLKAADAERARSAAAVFTSNAEAAELTVRQLQAAIDAMPPDPA